MNLLSPTSLNAEQVNFSSPMDCIQELSIIIYLALSGKIFGLCKRVSHMEMSIMYLQVWREAHKLSIGNYS